MENFTKMESIVDFEKIKYELSEMKKVDQEMRAIASSHIDDGKFHEYFDSSVDIKNTAKLKEIISQIGWPIISKVGEEASHDAWLLAQHADKDPEFQKECLSLMKLADEGEVKLRNIAYMEDRIKTREKLPQIYGTQFKFLEDMSIELFPVEDFENINDRRAEMGMEPIEEYLARNK